MACQDFIAETNDESIKYNSSESFSVRYSDKACHCGSPNRVYTQAVPSNSVSIKISDEGAKLQKDICRLAAIKRVHACAKGRSLRLFARVPLL